MRPVIISFLSFVFFLSSNIYSQNNFYIDPTATKGGDGTIENPFDSISNISWKSNSTYFIKRGTIIQESINIESDSVILDAYGNGDKPKIYLQGAKGLFVIRIFGDNCEIKNLDISTSNYTLGSIINFKSCNGGAVSNCDIHGADVGISTYYVSGTFKILNTIVHNIGQDAVYLSNHDSVFIDSCYVYDANMSFNDGIYGKGNGDGIQTNNIKFTRITNTVVDREGTNNKFCIILQSSDEIEMENCTLYGSDVIYDQFSIDNNIGMYALYLSGVGKGLIKNCKFYSGVNNVWNQYSSNITIDACEFYYPMNNCIDGAVNNMVIKNCFFHVSGYRAIVSGWSGPVGVTMYDNIFYNDSPIAGSADAIKAQDNIYYPIWHKIGLYDSNPIKGYLGDNYEIMLTTTIKKYKVINRRDSLQKYVYVHDTEFYEVYYLNDYENEDVKLLFDVNKKLFVAMPTNNAIYNLELRTANDSVVFSGQNISSITSISSRDWSDSICYLTLSSINNKTPFNEQLYRVDSLFYPKKFLFNENENINNKKFIVYYDKSSEMLKVKENDFDGIPFVVYIYNVQGYIYGTYRIESESAQIDISQLHDGLYISVVMYDVGLKQTSIKFIKY